MNLIGFIMVKLVGGIGFNDGAYPAYIKKKRVKQYGYWSKMLDRCNPVFQENFKTYYGCFASENFKSYSYFYEWCLLQKGFDLDGYELDKDLLAKGNKVYSEDTCLIVPRAVNIALTSCRSVRGKNPIGVVSEIRPRGIVYIARISGGARGKTRHIGIFDNKTEAFLAYKSEKEKVLKNIADKFKGVMSDKAYNALINYKIEMSD